MMQYRIIFNYKLKLKVVFKKIIGGNIFMKKLTVFITAMLMVLFISIPTNSVQAKGMDEIIKNVEQTNMQINTQIEKAVYAAKITTEEYNDQLMVLVKNKNEREIEKLKYKYDDKIDKIVKKLLEVTSKMSEKTINSAAKEGVTLYCDFVEVNIAGRIVLVDPIRIGNY